MGLRPAKCYREVTGPAYTRTAVRVMKKAYVRGVPGSKIRIFDMGNKSKREWKLQISLIIKEPKQLRHNQLEAARMAVNRQLVKKIGQSNFYFKIRVYPFHVLRENPLATGAGADRVQQGMRRAFGKPIGTAARVKAGQKVMSVFIDSEKFIPAAKYALKLAKNKLSGDYSIIVEQGPFRI